jgi:hypothetical protein
MTLFNLQTLASDTKNEYRPDRPRIKQDRVLITLRVVMTISFLCARKIVLYHPTSYQCQKDSNESLSKFRRAYCQIHSVFIVKVFSFETADSQSHQLSPSNNYKCSQSDKQTNPTSKLVSLAILKFFHTCIWNHGRRALTPALLPAFC